MSGLARVAFIGIGAMGWPMAQRVKAAGYPLNAYDNDAARLAEFCAATGATAAATPAKAAADAAFVVTMLPDSAIVESVVCGKDGVLSTLAKGSLLVEMSSGVPTHTVRIAEQVAAAGSTLVDAPVSGGVPRARTGELAIMAGGGAAAVDRAEPLLRTMGNNVLRTGAVGTAHAMKALNNLVSAGGFLIGVEAMLIGQRAGLDPAVMVDVLNASTGMNNSTQKKFKQFVLSRRFDSGFRLDLMVKDLGIALGLAREEGVPAPFASLCRELWGAASAAKVGDDHTAMARLAETLAGFELSSEQIGKQIGKQIDNQIDKKADRQ